MAPTHEQEIRTTLHEPAELPPRAEPTQRLGKLYPCERSRFFFFNDTATTEIYTLSLHDALPINRLPVPLDVAIISKTPRSPRQAPRRHGTDRKSTRLNSSHVEISYAVFCLKKKKNTERGRHKKKKKKATKK